MKRKIVYLTVICTILGGCNDPSKDGYSKLKAENERLNIELDECKFGAKKSLAEADQSFKARDYQKAKESLSKLIEKHPATAEAKLGKILLDKTNDALRKIENDKKLSEEIERREKEAAIANATKSMAKRYNEFTETYWYQDLSSPRYVNRNGFYLEFGKSKSGSLTELFLNIQYYAEDWLFVEYISFTIDGKPFRYFPGDMERDSGYGGKIWEWKRTS
ncbi:MAG: hypothetical protein WC209_01090 [Ignavibacteriaceae bacterium]|jgi:hypothetical protein